MTEEKANKYQHVVNAFKSRRFDTVRFAHTAREARQAVLELIPNGAKVATGGSTTLMKLIESQLKVSLGRENVGSACRG